MKTSLKSDDFYVQAQRNGRMRDFLSVNGILFLGELMMESAKVAELDPAKMSIDIDGHCAISLAYPSPATKLVTWLQIKEGKLSYYPRVGSKWQSKSLQIADPNLIQQFAEVLKENLPKNSKFAVKDNGNNPQL